MNGLIDDNSFNAIVNYPVSWQNRLSHQCCCNFIPVYTIHVTRLCFFHKIFFKMTKLPSPHLQPLAKFKSEQVAAVGGHVRQEHNFLQSTGTGAASHVPSGPSYCPLLVPHRVPVCVGTVIDDHDEEGLEPTEQRVGAARGQPRHGAGEEHRVVVGHEPADTIEADGAPQAGHARQERDHLNGQHAHLLPCVEPHTRPLHTLSSKAPGLRGQCARRGNAGARLPEHSPGGCCSHGPDPNVGPKWMR
jgi:hypothetical protein